MLTLTTRGSAEIASTSAVSLRLMSIDRACDARMPVTLCRPDWPEPDAGTTLDSNKAAVSENVLLY